LRIAERRLTTAFSEELEKGENEGERAGGEAAHGEHESEPTAIGVRALARDTAEDGQHQSDGDDTCEEDEEAGSEEFAVV